eukprot:CAMPEP_0115865256 /NCGR_PEP_ID=MMETSP0287-20121206/19627_1 /TAXON_ID=412157 /ORGANISM="Chrysochromulina rotalis, Strain UIO044" /LENGTH=80 /DNA_ID=CAMNT_0003319761 /DNA_START=467 /DNA_END=705 /DNA_ORIENTATION=-
MNLCLSLAWLGQTSASARGRARRYRCCQVLGHGLFCQRQGIDETRNPLVAHQLYAPCAPRRVPLQAVIDERHRCGRRCRR